jgi:hypothetical protein
MEFVLIVILIGMKKSKKILIAVLLVSLTLLVAFQFGLFTPYNYFTAIRDVLTGKIQLIEYGEPLLPITESAIHKLEDSPGVKTISLGCVITTQEINGIKQYNYVMKEFLNH